MPSSCCAFGCASRYSKKKGVKLYRFPRDPERRSLWIQAIKREKWQPNEHSRICGRHFISGRPSRFRNDPDFVPSIFVFSKTKEKENASRVARYQRLIKRRVVLGSIENRDSSDHGPDDVSDHTESTFCDVGVQAAASVCDQCINTNSRPKLRDQSSQCAAKLPKKKILKNGSVCTDLTSVDIDQQNEQLHSLQRLNIQLEEKLLNETSPVLKLRNDDERTHFYTGLPSYAVFNVLLSKLAPQICDMGSVGSGLSVGDEFLLVLMKLSRALTNQDLAYRFGTHVTKVTKVFHRWIDLMAVTLKPLIAWPDKGMVLSTLPASFKPHYCHATCIIDCSEVFIERPTSLVARAQTYSNYKSHNTVKFLVAISPTGAIIYISKCWGGRVSDKHLTRNCGFLEHIQHGDLVLADRGFDISDELALIGASLAVPPFTRGKSQLSQREVELSRALSHVRIHVERAIGRMKYYKILHSTLPISLIKRPHETEICTIDKILISCAALSNLQPPLVT